jgi:hypothetical protein
MQDTTEHVTTNNRAKRWPASKRNRRLLIESLVGTRRVEIVDIFPQDTLQMSLIEDQELIQAFLSYRTHLTFGKRVGIGCSIRGQDSLDTFRRKDGFKGARELGIPILDEKADRWHSVWELPQQLAGLLGYPGRVGLICTACQIHPTCAHLNKKQHIYCLQQDGLNGQKVAGQQLRPIVVQEGPPVAVRPVAFWRGRNMAPSEHIPHGGNAYVIA